MNLGELKKYIESFPDGTRLEYSLSEPFSWRGVYAEVAFSIKDKQCTKEELLAKIEMALSDEFYGYKGGDFRYDEHTPVNFEEDCGSYTDGGYTEKKISEILKLSPASSPEERLVKLAFKN